MAAATDFYLMYPYWQGGGQTEPCPNDMVTSLPFDDGVYQGCYQSRPEAAPSSAYEEFVTGRPSIPALSNYYIEGLNTVTPQFKAVTTGSITFSITLDARKLVNDPLLELRFGTCMYRYRPNDTAVILVASKDSAPISFGGFNPYTVSNLRVAGVTFAEGDRLGFDVWWHIYNGNASGISGALLGEMRWATSLYPGNMASTIALQPQLGIQVPTGRWGGDG